MNSYCDSFIAYESPDEFAVVGKTVEVGIYTFSGTATVKATVKT